MNLAVKSLDNSLKPGIIVENLLPPKPEKISNPTSEGEVRYHILLKPGRTYMIEVINNVMKRSSFAEFNSFKDTTCRIKYAIDKALKPVIETCCFSNTLFFKATPSMEVVGCDILINGYDEKETKVILFDTNLPWITDKQGRIVAIDYRPLVILQ